MSKKKRKTRREKETNSGHQFSHVGHIGRAGVVRPVAVEEGQTEIAAKSVKTEVVSPYVMKDLKKVLTVMGIVILFVVLMWVLAYYTKLLNGFFGYFRISY
jgi:hypothetical protein